MKAILAELLRQVRREPIWWLVLAFIVIVLLGDILLALIGK